MIYITGATGRLGKEVLRLIPKAIPLTRKKSNIKNEIITDFSPEQLQKILKDCDVLIHIAASLNFNNPQAMYESNVILTKKLAEALPKNAKIIYAGSISVYGKELLDNPATEETACNPDTDYAKTKYEAEKIVLSRDNSVSLRIGVIYGEQFEEYSTILKLLKKGFLPIIGNGNNVIPFVSVKSVANAFKNAISAPPGVYIIAGNELTQKEIMKITAAELNVKPPHYSIPLSLAVFAGWVEEVRGRLFGIKPKFTREHMLILGTNRKFDCRKAKKDLNFVQEDLKKGIRNIILKLKF